MSWFGASSPVVPSCSASTGSCFLLNYVGTRPDIIVLHVMPFNALTSAVTFVKPTWPKFTAQIGGFASGIRPCTEDKIDDASLFLFLYGCECMLGQ
ncbi:hypothetical protein P4597_15420 [Peribacillus simplex]|uniref:hypothetical protein n=1 Tax=Peribacillus simplex TaxID=1478 RepID=UPI002E1BB3CC|nr:hypothetical protein [Peribacillus simplex]